MFFPGNGMEKELYPEIVKELEALAEKARSDLGDELQERCGIREKKSFPN